MSDGSLSEADPSETHRFFDAVYEGNRRKAAGILRRAKLNSNVVDRRRPDRPTALLHAAERGDLEMVDFLLKVKPVPADVDAANSSGKRCIWFACERGDEKLAKILISHGCDVNYVDQQTGCTPLYRTVLKNTVNVCRLLAQAGADVNLRRLGYGTGAKTPLIEAVILDNVDICGVLVNSLCDINCQAEGGYSALHYAVAYQRYQVAKFLLENRIDLRNATRSGVTAMAVAIEHRDPVMCRMLVEHGYDISLPYSWRETPLQQAIHIHSEECALTLVAWGSPVNPATDAKPSDFYSAAREGLVTLMVLMAEINPSLFNEAWVQKRTPPVALYKRPDVLDWMRARAATVRPLKVLCRASVHRHLRVRQPENVLRLSLPKDILNYLAFPEIVDQRMYRQMQLSPRCPYDCDSQHAATDVTCADIDISDVDSKSDDDDYARRTAEVTPRHKVDSDRKKEEEAAAGKRKRRRPTGGRSRLAANSGPP